MYYRYRSHFSLEPIVFNFYGGHFQGLWCLEWWLYTDSLLVSHIPGVSASEKKQKMDTYSMAHDQRWTGHYRATR